MKKQIFTLLAISFFTIQLTGQPTFQKFITANGILNAGNLKKTGDSGFVVTGYYRERGRETIPYILLAKLDTRARLQWIRVFGDGIIALDGEVVTTFSDGGYAVTGVVHQYQTFNYAVFVAKFNSEGDVIWTKKISYTVQGFSSIFPLDITETKNGSLLVTGETSSTDSGDEFVLSMKSTNGNVNWLRTVGTVNYRETGRSIHITDDGGFIAGGITIPDGGNFLIVKYNNKGIPEWTKTIAGNSSSVMYSIIPTLDNGYAFTGITYAGDLNYNIVAVKLNSRHNIEWSKIISRSTYDAGYGIMQVKEDSSYFIAGGESLIFQGNAFLIHLNKNGKLLSSRLSGGVGDYAYYTSVTRDRSSIVTAGSSSNKIFITKFDDKGNTCNDSDANDTASKNFRVDTVNVDYVSKDITNEAVIENYPLNELGIDAHVRVICTSNNNLIASENNNAITNDAGLFSFKIYPNPIVGDRSNITIVCKRSNNIMFNIISAEGKLHLSQSMFIPEGSSTKSINVSSLPEGVYILRVSDGKEQKTIKFVKGK